MHLTTVQIEDLLKAASQHGGMCPTCYSTIKLYKYRVSETMAKIMREMAKATKATGQRAIDMETLDLTHTERSQLSKMRQHGLIVQPKDDNGVKKARHWLITSKGWQFLRGEDIPAKTLVFQNQVLGHEGGTTNIRRLLNDPGFYEADPLTTAEARTYHDVRTPQKLQQHLAAYLGYSSGNLINGHEYVVSVERLQIGKPVKAFVTIKEGEELLPQTFNDIAAFQRQWKVINRITEAVA
jgi:hypothetical protein